jgi:serine/threonine protein kinase/tetratricopeptide (TPR) repeat protein
MGTSPDAHPDVTSGAGITLGPFELLRHHQTGGMADVWVGRHRASQVPVAIKVSPPLHEVDDLRMAALRNETYAAARLEHPHIVRLLDYGDLPAETAQASSGALSAGSPFLVMELLSGDSLYARPRPGTWAELREILEAILDALAYAHARGVLHRDLTPRNVLFGTDEDQRPGLKLIDFGLAHWGSAPDDILADRVMGTPGFVAPEHLDAAMRLDHGPWTDLFSLGVLATWLATGALPFDPARGLAAFDEEAPPLTTGIAAPDGFAGWVARLLRVDLRERFQSAAHAACNLARMEGPQATPPRHDERHARRPSRTLPSLLPETLPQGDALPEEAPQRTPARSPLPAAVWPSLPDSWRDAGNGSEAPLASASLFSLRTHPFVGREAERDALWALLGEVATSGEARLVVISGTTGMGKSHLAEWLTQQAHTAGCLPMLRARHSETPLIESGIGGMMAELLRTTGLEGAARERRIREVVLGDHLGDEHDVACLRELIEGPAGSMEDNFLYHRSPAHAAQILRLLQRYRQGRGADGPMVMVLDDVQWGAESLVFARQVMEEQPWRRFPVLLVLTVRSDLLATRPHEARTLESLMAAHAGVRIELDALDVTARRELVRSLAPLEPATADAMADASAGPPLFAVHLMGDWIHRGVLVAKGRTFVVADGSVPAPPRSLSGLWRRRLSRVCRQASEDLGLPEASVQAALEMAAALGPELTGEEWGAACACCGVPTPDPLGELLRTAELARPTETGWRFAHGSLRDALIANAREGSRLAAHQRACAELRGATPEANPERLARHYLGAGRPEDALEHLLVAAHRHNVRAELGAAEQVLAALDLALDDAAVPPDDPRRLAAWMERGLVLARQRSFTEGKALLARCADLARRLALSKLAARALLRWGTLERRTGNFTAALSLAEEAVPLAIAGDDPSTEISGRRLAVVCHSALGNLAEAHAVGEVMVRAAERSGSPAARARAYVAMADVERKLGRYREARDWGSRAIPIFRDTHDLPAMAAAIGDYADSCRLAGDFDEAITGFESAKEWMLRVGSAGAIMIPQLNTGLLLLQMRRFEDARPHLEKARARCVRLRHSPAGLCIIEVGLAVSDGAAGDWAGADRRVAWARAKLAEIGFYDPDIPELAELGAELARSAGDSARARALWSLAREQWHRLNRPEDAARVAAELAGADP